jgi:GTP-binding protein
MKFIDVAEIKVRAGSGGLGMAHFRREKYVAFGGPDGGNGGPGGDIILESRENLTTLLDFKYHRNHEGNDGEKGGTNRRQGRSGEPKVLFVPCGTMIFDSQTDQFVGELLEHGQQLVVAQGGKGGIGNAVFASSRNQSPTRIIPPVPGEIKQLRLELKLIADIGIIGAPNAGKSTLVTAISAARPKVADYPFTTLVPTLGVVSHRDAAPFVVADVPGLIEGASQGKGLGHEFLRHVERTKALIHLIDGSGESTEQMKLDYHGILKECEIYNSNLLARPRLTVISKLDSLGESPQLEPAVTEFLAYLKSQNVEPFLLSCANRVGIRDLLDACLKILDPSSYAEI